MNYIDAIYVLTIGFYFCMSLGMGIVLFFGLTQSKQGGASPLMRMGGIVMILDSACILCSLLYSYFLDQSPAMGIAILVLGILVSIQFILTGFTLIDKEYPSPHVLALVVGPLITLAALCVMAGFSILVDSFIYTGSCIIYAGYLIFRFKRHDKDIRLQYSNIEGRTTSWFIIFAVWIILINPLSVVIGLIDNFQIWGSIYNVVVIVEYCFLFHNIRLQERNVVENISSSDSKELNKIPAEDESSSTIKSAPHLPELTPKMAEKVRKNIIKLMEKDKLYLNPDLTVNDIVTRLNTNTSYFYYFLRDVMHTRFFDLVNGYRIEEAKRLLLSGMTVEATAKQSGFNSTNTLNRVFKTFTGTTPAQWRNSNAAK